MSNIILKCKKCRSNLFDSETTHILTGHNKTMQDFYHPSSAEGDCRETIDSLYLEDVDLPQWLMNSLYEANWERGKVNCPNCSARLGSFDFITGRKCSCGQQVVPPIHLVRSKVDVQKRTIST